MKNHSTSLATQHVLLDHHYADKHTMCNEKARNAKGLVKNQMFTILYAAFSSFKWFSIP